MADAQSDLASKLLDKSSTSAGGVATIAGWFSWRILLGEVKKHIQTTNLRHQFPYKSSKSRYKLEHYKNIARPPKVFFFCCSRSKSKASALPGAIAATFRIWDTDGNGKLSRAELGAVLRKAMPQISQTHLDAGSQLLGQTFGRPWKNIWSLENTTSLVLFDLVFFLVWSPSPRSLLLQDPHPCWQYTAC